MDATTYNGAKAVSPVVQTALRLIKELNEHGIQIEPRAYKITKLNPEALKFALDVNKIPYIELKTKDTILVARENIAACWQLEQQHKTKGNFLQEYDSKKLESVIEKHPAVKNKQIVAIKNMQPAEASLFLKKCNRIKQGLLLETEKLSNGNYNIDIPVGLLSEADRERITKAYLQTQIGLYGVNAAAKALQKFTPTKEAYENAVKERRLTDALYKMIEEKLRRNNISLNDFGNYLKSFKLQLKYAFEQLQKGAALSGFDEALVTTTREIYHALPEHTYDYTVSYINKKQIDTHLAMAETIQINTSEPTQQKERE